MEMVEWYKSNISHSTVKIKNTFEVVFEELKEQRGFRIVHEYVIIFLSFIG